LQDVDVSIYRYLQCAGTPGSEDVGAMGDGVFMLDTADNLELVDKFRYLGDMLGKGGGAEEAQEQK